MNNEDYLFSPYGLGSSSAHYILVAILVVLAAVVAVVLWRYLKKNEGVFAFFDGKADIAKVADRINLKKEDQSFMRTITRQFRINDWDFYLKNDESLDGLFKKIYDKYASNHADADRNEKLKHLFNIRQQIDINRRNRTYIMSSKNILSGQQLILVTPQREQYSTTVLKNDMGGLVVRTPTSDLGKKIEMPPMMKVGVFFRRSYAEYIYTTRIVSSIFYQGLEAFILNHSDKLVILTNRLNRRVNIFSDISFAAATASEVPNKKTGKSEISYSRAGDASHNATLVDISVGGACFSTHDDVLKAGDLVSLNIYLDKGELDEIFAKVIGVRRLENGKFNVHVKFSKITVDAQNKIFAIVYKYGG